MENEATIVENEIEQDPIDIITDLRNNTVSKNEYDKLKAQNSKLLQALAKGEQINVQQNDVVDVDKLRRELYASDAKPLSNLEYAQKTLQLRKAIMDAGGVDPMVPSGVMIAPTQEDYACANNLAQVLQDCIDAANGDSGIFTAELQRRTRDVRLH